MVQLSAHFTLKQLEVEGDAAPAVCIPTLAILCVEILEPVLEHVGAPLYFTSGYRSPRENVKDHGQANSEHVATADYCACDFFCNDVEKVFDWMRNNDSLPYHQLIKEKGKVGYVIHVSWNRLKPGVRSVLVGATNNSQPYQQIAHVAFNPNPEVNA